MNKEILGVEKLLEWHHIDNVKSVNSSNHCQHHPFVPIVTHLRWDLISRQAPFY
jgi:hypothetical protein